MQEVKELLATKELTPIDAKILHDLLKDGRKAFTQIANDCGEKKDAICKRFKELQKSGIIVGSTVQLDYAALGYNSVGNIFFKVHPENIVYAVDHILEIPDIYHAIKLDNNTAVDVVATLKMVDDFNRVKEMIKRLPTVSELTTNVWMGIRNIPENLQITNHDPSARVEYLKKLSHKSIEIDEVDKKLIEKLSKNGRAPFSSLAKELEISVNTVIKKYERLKQNGIIKVTLQVNAEKMGYRAKVRFSLAFASQDSLTFIVNKLSSIPDVYLIIKTSGQYDLNVYSMVRDIDQLMNLQNEISKIAEISKKQMFLLKPKQIFPGYKEYISTF
jgi:Lrp/AsnC family transcriptional regulator, regulator for asnA, asnC and gidA